MGLEDDGLNPNPRTPGHRIATGNPFLRTYKGILGLYYLHLLWLGGGFIHFFEFSPRTSGDNFQFEKHIFQMGWFNHHPIWGFSNSSGVNSLYVELPE